MTPARPDDPNPLTAYADGAPGAVEAARPIEPTGAQWDAVSRAIHARLQNVPAPAREGGRWRSRVLVAGAAVLATLAAAVAWFALAPVAVKNDVAESRPLPPAPEVQPDPLAEFAVLPIAGAEEVELRRVPGSGVLPVGADPLPDVLVLATAREVELDDPDSTWPVVAPAPGDAPMIFAAKPR